MSLGINTNIASLSAQRALSSSQSDAATAMQRLSTGLRINSAKDDAAGLAVSNAMTSRINGFNQASRNANDAVSLLQTADGGMQSITDNLQRIRELAVQASNDSLSSTERGYLDTEVQGLIAEMERVADSTSFNGLSLLTGTYASTALNFQVGPGAATTDSFGINIADVQTGAMGKAVGTNSIVGTEITNDITDDDVKVNGVSIGAVTQAGSGNSLAAGVAAAIEVADSDVTATVTESSFTMGAWTDIDATGGTGVDNDTYQFAVEGVDLFATDALGADPDTVTDTEFDAALTAKAADLATAGVTFTGSATSDNLVFKKADGSNLQVTQTLTTADATAVSGGFANLTFGAISGGDASSDVTKFGGVTLTSGSAIAITGTDSAGMDKGGFQSGNRGSAVAGTAIADIDVTDRTNALAAITAVDNALSTVNTSRASVGAYQSRMESVLDTVAVSAENATASRSRILDANFAQESADLAKDQVLQQAGISVLAQANAMPQQVLALLQ